MANEAPPGPVARHSIEPFAVPSTLLGRTLPCTLLVPSSGRVEGVLYLLHGGYSHHREWAGRVDLARLVAGRPLAIALPEGEFSLFIHGYDGRNWERYAALEVPRAVEDRLGLSLDRTRRAVAGISMGGFGALHLGLTYPERYGAVATLSAALGMTWWQVGQFPGSPFLPALGPPGSGTRAWVDPWRTLERALAAVGPEGLPPLWLSTGTEDDAEVTEAHRALHASLERAGVPHTYREVPGGHDWGFWSRETPTLLGFLASQLHLDGRPAPG